MTTFCRDPVAAGLDPKARAALRRRLLTLLDPAAGDPLPSPDTLLTGLATRLDAEALADLRQGLWLLVDDLAVWSGREPALRPEPLQEPRTAPVFDAAGRGERPSFTLALRALMGRHGDTTGRLHAALARREPRFTRPALCAWLRGCDLPTHARNLHRLKTMEDRYGLDPGYFRDQTSLGGRAVRRAALPGLTRREQAIAAWHIPDDFEARPVDDQAQVIAWVRRNVLPGATPFRTWLTPVSREPYVLQFTLRGLPPVGDPRPVAGRRGGRAASARPGVPRRPPAPEALNREIDALVTFKTEPLTPLDLLRRRTWRAATAQLQVSRLAALYGALMRSPDARQAGLGLEPEACSAALLVMPQVWDWFLGWRHARRGSYTGAEVGLIRLAAALCSRPFGWLRQNPQLKARLVPVPPLLDAADVEAVRIDWDRACDRLERFATTRLRDVTRLSRKHRDPFEPIAPVLSAPSPLGAYRKIADEAARHLPDRMGPATERAEALRFLLIFRLTLHLGFRQRSLREMTFQPKDAPASSHDRAPAHAAELRWCATTAHWTVSAPPSAFKNSESSFFAGQPYFLQLPDLDGLNLLIDEYLAEARPQLLSGAPDSGHLFVRSMQRRSARSNLSSNAFYKIWYDGVRRYGIYNPFTQRGAIEGLLAHGPHSARDVLATHVLKTTGSFLTASYAIQDTPRMVEKHYGRFLPVDKIGIAADVLNRVWAD